MNKITISGQTLGELKDYTVPDLIDIADMTLGLL